MDLYPRQATSYHKCFLISEVIHSLGLSVQCSQLYLASTLYLRTSSLSNATVNLTLTAEPTDLSITTAVNTSISLIVAVNIPESQTTTLGVTVLQEDVPTRFDVESITLTVSNARCESHPEFPLNLEINRPCIVQPPRSCRRRRCPFLALHPSLCRLPPSHRPPPRAQVMKRA